MQSATQLYWILRGPLVGWYLMKIVKTPQHGRGGMSAFHEIERVREIAGADFQRLERDHQRTVQAVGKLFRYAATLAAIGALIQYKTLRITTILAFAFLGTIALVYHANRLRTGKNPLPRSR